jgi:serine/threonine protein phosphatase 1
MNKYVISDIHGCFFTFQELLSKISFSKNDELILLGDYVNRGQRSKEVLDKIIELQQDNYKIIALRGNHEDMIFDSIALENWTAGEEETLQSFGITYLKNLDKKYLRWLRSLKSHHLDENYIFVHAGLNFTNENPLEDKQSMRWLIDWYDTINYNWLKDRKIIHGHEILSKAEIIKITDKADISKVINIDNGCYLKGKPDFGNLCCLNLTKMEIIFQENIE